MPHKIKSRFMFITTMVILIFLSTAISGAEDIVTINPVLNTSSITSGVVDLAFYTCGEDDLTSTIYCRDDFSIVKPESIKLNGCYLSVFDLNTIDCSDAKIISTNGDETYEKDLDIIKTIIDKDFILNRQTSEGDFGSADTTAMGIWFMSQFGDKYEDRIDKAMVWLKKNRDNSLKCWPSGGCSAFTTAKTLAYLHLAGISSYKNVLYDAIAWLEKRQNYIISSSWNYQVDAYEDNTNCTISINGGSASSIGTLNDSETYTNDITIEYGDDFNLSCSETASFRLRDHKNSTIYYAKSSTSDIEYNFPDAACWSYTQWRGCDIPTTIYALIANISTSHKTNPLSYLETELSEHLILGEYIPLQDRFIYTALYYKYLNQDEELVKYLVFNQNNDGSFGTDSEDKYMNTIFALWALKNVSYTYAQETITDAKLWISKNIMKTGLSDVEKDTIYYLTIQDNETKYIKSDPKISVIENKTTRILLTNPSYSNYSYLRYKFSKVKGIDDSNLSAIIKIDNISSLVTEDSKNLTITRTDDTGGMFFGVIGIYASDTNTSTYNYSNSVNLTDLINIINIPVIVNTTAKLSVNLPKTVEFMGSSSTIKLSIDSINTDYSCNITSSDSKIIFDSASFDIKKGEKEKEIGFKTEEAQRRKIESTVSIACLPKNSLLRNSLPETNIKKDFSSLVAFQQYPTEIISILPEDITITGNQEETITIKNMIGERVEVTLDFEKNDDGMFEGPLKVSIEPYKEKEVKLYNRYRLEANFTSNNSVTYQAKAQKGKIPLNIEIIHTPFLESVWFVMIITLIVIILIGFIGAMGYKYSDYAVLYFRKAGNLMKKKTGKSGNENKTEKPQKKKVDFMKQLKEQAEEIYSKIPEDMKKQLKLPKFLFKKEEVVVETKKKFTMEKTGVEELIKVMKQLGKNEKEIKKELSDQGMSAEEVARSLSNVQKEMEEEESLHQTEDVVNVLQALEKGGDDVREALKKQGFTDSQISNAFMEIEEEVEEKEEEIEARLKEIKKDDNDESGEEEGSSLTDLQKKQEENK